MGLAEHPSPDAFTARRSWRLQWLICFAASTLVVLLGVDFGRFYVVPGPWFKAPEPLIGLMANWDGGFFVGIVQTGYSYTPGKASLIHFSPVYPLSCTLGLSGLFLAAYAPYLLGGTGWFNGITRVMPFAGATAVLPN